MTRPRLSTSLFGIFAFLTSGFALAQTPPSPPPAAPAPSAAPPSAPAPESPPAAPPAEQTPPPEEPKPAEPPPATDAKPTEAPAATAKTDAAEAEAEKPVSGPKDELARPGYIPGYRRYPSVGLPPYVPASPPTYGGTTVPYGAPAPADTWNFNYSGFFAAGVRAVIRQRPLPPGSERNSLALRNAVQTGEPFSAGGTQGSWVQMTFEYGNRIATAHVGLTTWNPSRGASFTQLGSQNFVDSAYMTFRVPPIEKLKLGLAIGAFSQTYGNLGQYGGGFYTNQTGQIGGMGATISGEYNLTESVVLTADYGLMGGDKAPGGCEKPPIGPDGHVAPCPVGTTVAPLNLGDSYDPARWVQHFHVGMIQNGDVTIQGQLHYMQNWSQDDRGLLPMAEPPTSGSLADYSPDPRAETPVFELPGGTYGLDESRTRGDGRYDAYGATLGLRGGQWFRGGVGVTYAKAENAYALHGLNVSFVGDGETFTRDWIGPRSVNPKTGDIEGSLWTGATEAEFSWGTLWRAPEPFWGEGFNVITGLGFQYGVVGSFDPLRDGWKMYRFGVDTTVSIFPWLATWVRIDQVNPNLDEPEQIFYAFTARLTFRTWWNSHESVALQYNKWIYGDEVPINFRAPPSEKLDTDALSLGFGMWW